jgi:hypothetical protein
MSVIRETRMVEVESAYLESIERDSYFLQCLDACGAPFTDVWAEAQEMFNFELDEG